MGRFVLGSSASCVSILPFPGLLKFVFWTVAEEALGAYSPASLTHLPVQKILHDDRHGKHGHLDNRLDAPRSFHYAHLLRPAIPTDYF